jgi:hypothetical protein
MSPLIGDLTWERLARDQRVRRLRRGKHFRGEMRAVQREAHAAAAQMGLVARVVRDDFRKHAYVWVQFKDFEVPLGEPCPACGGREIVRTHEHFGRCAECQASLAFVAGVQPAEVSERQEDGEAAVPEAKLNAKLDRVRQRDLSRTIDQFGDVKLVLDPDESDEEQEVWYGRGEFGGNPVLVRLVYPLRDGARQPHPFEPEHEYYFLRYWPLAPFERASDLGVDIV